MSELTRRQALACDLAEAARTPEQVDAAHVAIIRAFPTIAAAYPCDCSACRKAGLAPSEKRS